MGEREERCRNDKMMHLAGVFRRVSAVRSKKTVVDFCKNHEGAIPICGAFVVAFAFNQKIHQFAVPR